ncbi:hypothetical protein [Pelagibacterium montanilacus]|uniref:hypothetical protein n=1 Tax=Pelagibacterium montanilacus TaxID=2185280 RepID=UPI000F8E6B58|nr:hypothetical protein [Pelagibacterium montanilacus]
MFAYQAGETPASSDRKKRLRESARRQWAFLTPLDLTMTDTEAKLAVLVHIRSGVSDAQSVADVRQWLAKETAGPVNSA